MDSNRKSKPWFLWLCYGAVHGPFTPARKYKKLYENTTLAIPPVDIFGPRPTKPEHMKYFTRCKKGESGMPIGYDSAVKKYHKAVRSLDDGVGDLLKALKVSGQLKNTVVIFTSGQGFAWGQHGSREKWMPYDANICSPLVFSYPNYLLPGLVCMEPVNGVDITRTIHSIAKIEPEWEMHGRNLLPLLKNHKKKLKEPLLMINTIYEYGDKVLEKLKSGNTEAFSRKGLPAWMMLRHGKYKYIRYLKEGIIEELYDMDIDPKELVNLAVNDDFSTLLTELRIKTIKAFRKRDGDFVDYLPEIRIL